MRRETKRYDGKTAATYRLLTLGAEALVAGRTCDLELISVVDEAGDALRAEGGTKLTHGWSKKKKPPPGVEESVPGAVLPHCHYSTSLHFSLCGSGH